MLSYLNFNQFNFVHNHVILDLVLSNVHISVSIGPNPLLPIDIHYIYHLFNFDNYDSLITVYDLTYDFNDCYNF